VITDEVIKSETLKTKKINTPKREVVRSRKGYERGLSNAFKIIVVSAATTIFAMAPLLFMGLGKLSGFALTTIVGVLIGILVTRPAYGEIIKETMVS
jgi:preprotein translocase subunit SecD